MNPLLPTSAGLAVLILSLLGERCLLSALARRIPVRICVTGTRGKSSLVRLIAAALREGGITVLAKTTGSHPALLLPDGTERSLSRRGRPSILEQRRVLRTARRLGVQALVAEVMSIGAENQYAEIIQILKPNVVAVTNIRLDHLPKMGSSKTEIARNMAASVPRGCRVFLPRGGWTSPFAEMAARVPYRLEIVSPAPEAAQLIARLPYPEFEENIRLALEISAFLKIPSQVAVRGMTRVKPDRGNLRLWKLAPGAYPVNGLVVNAFAANDPESTLSIVSRLSQTLTRHAPRWIGLLNLRADRGSRTLQWLSLLKQKPFPLRRLLLIGDYASAVAFKRRYGLNREESISQVAVLSGKTPELIMDKLFQGEDGNCVVFGFGNLGGEAGKLVDYWERVGRPYALSP